MIGATVIDALPLGGGCELRIVDAGDGRLTPVPWVIPSEEGVDASSGRGAEPGDGVAAALVRMLAGGSRPVGRFDVVAFPAAREAREAREGMLTGERSFGVDQTNTSVVVGERAVVKWMREAEPGPHPAPAMLQALTTHGFAGTPQPWGLLLWRADGDAHPRLVATVDTLLPDAVDGWTWAVDDVRAAVVAGDDAPVIASGQRIGRLIADLHAALAETGRPATGADLAAWRDAAERDLALALAATSASAHELLEARPAGATATSAPELLAARSGAIRKATAIADDLVGTPLILTHGDLHVGQILRAGAVDVVTDFDGNPVVPPAERTTPQPAAVDVAGMAQSISHAALVLRRHEPQHSAARVAEASEAFVRSFLRAYESRLTSLGAGALYEPSLLAGLRIQQICREFTYAATHLPRWSYVPEAAIVDLLPASTGNAPAAD